MTLKTHLALNTVHFDDAVTFYRAFLGADPVKLRGGYAKFDLDQPPLNLTLNQVPEGTTLGGTLSPLNHMGVQVGSTDAVLEAAQRLRETGLDTLEEMDTDCCTALQDKVWVADPDGNRWEVFVVKVADTGPEAVPEGTRACGCGPDCCTEEAEAA